MKDSVAKNVQKWGTGAINIDATRIPQDGPRPVPGKKDANGMGYRAKSKGDFGQGMMGDAIIDPNQWRFPSNVIGEIAEPNQKYFYCPKVSKKERNIGCDDLTNDNKDSGTSVGIGLRTGYSYCGSCDKSFNGTNDHTACDPSDIKYKDAKPSGNNHPTVKPVELMKYLIKMVTAPGGKVLDPFNGSGSTGMAAVELGFDYTGIELDPAYVDIANKRITAWNQKHNLPGHLFK
jgi:site-specific DNA-methyltransferase (adenine-specific)